MTPRTMKAKREKLGLTQLELANDISETVLKGIMNPISQQVVSSMENGTRNIQPYIVKYFEIKG